MKFDLSQQPLVPAFLTLAIVSVAAACRADFAEAAAGASPAIDGLAIAMPGRWLALFGAAHPAWSRAAAAFLMVFAGMCVGRVTVRYALYGVSTCVAIPLFGFAAVCASCGGEALPALTASALLALTFKNFCRAFCNGYRFDALFRASLYDGALIAVCPEALPLALLLPLAVRLFRRTVRESVVAVCGLVLPVLAVCYFNWGAGGDFLAPLSVWKSCFAPGSPFGFVSRLPLPALALAGCVSLLGLCSMAFLATNIYATGSKSRYILFFAVGVWMLCLTAAAFPASTTAVAGLWAVPSAVLLPLCFVRLHRALALPVYLLLAGLTVWVIVLQ